MVLESFSQLHTGFEGCEKKLEICFKGNSLRAIGLADLQRILRLAQCVVISEKRGVSFDSYILSESSLFVFEHTIILKTCGTTALLSSLPLLLSVATQNGSFVEDFSFSRSNFLFPDCQPYPHKSFDTEVACINEFFAGQAHTIGPINGPRLNIFVYEERKPVLKLPAQTLELVMYDLSAEKTKKFYERPFSGAERYDGKKATVESKINLLFPNAIIDDHLFSPCGYSCNATVDGDYYFTIHVTPEPECSFASFETNYPAKSYINLVRDVVRIFEPANFSAFLVEKNMPRLPLDTNPAFWNVGGYLHTTLSATQVGRRHVIHYGNFKLVNAKKNPEYGACRYCAESLSTDDAASHPFSLVVNEEHSVSMKSCGGTLFETFEKLDYRFVKSFAIKFLKERFSVQKVNKRYFEKKPCFFGNLLRKLINESGANEGFFVMNLETLLSELFTLKTSFPDIKLFFPLSFYTNPLLLMSLNLFNFDFTCSNIEHVDILIDLGIKSERILMENVFLDKQSIEKALRLGVRRFTAAVDEKRLLPRLAKTAVLLGIDAREVRVTVAITPGSFASTSGCKSKLAKTLATAASLGFALDSLSLPRRQKGQSAALRSAHALGSGLALVFHCGGERDRAPSFERCVAFLRQRRQNAPGAALGAVLSGALVTPAMANVVHIISTRQDAQPRPLMNYFVDDGIYENFLSGGRVEAQPELVPKSNSRSKKRRKRRRCRRKAKPAAQYESVVWGRTCDSIDCIAKSARLPRLECDDWLFFRNLDVESMNAGTRFNGYAADARQTYYVVADD